MCKDQINILVIDDEINIREQMQVTLELCGFKVYIAKDGADGEKVMSQSGSLDVIIIDEHLGESQNGIDWMNTIKPKYPDLEFIVLTRDLESRKKALRAGAYRFFAKSQNPTELPLIIRSAALQVRQKIINQKILDECSLDNVIREVLNSIRALTVADLVEIVLHDEKTHQKITYSTDLSMKTAWVSPLSYDDLLENSPRTKDIVSIPDISKDTRINIDPSKSDLKSFIRLPVFGNEQLVFGALYIYSRNSNQFDEYGMVSMLQIMAGKTGIAVQNIRAYENKEYSAGQLNALNEIMIEIEKEENPDVLLQKVLEKAIELLSGNGGGVNKLNPAGDKFLANLITGIPGDKIQEEFAVNVGLCGKILKEKKAISIKDYYRWKDRNRYYDEFRFTGVVGAPIFVDNQIIGILLVHDIKPNREFSVEDVSILQKFATHAGLILKRSKLMESMKIIQSISTVISTQSTLQDIFFKTCEEAVRIFEVDHSGLVLFDSSCNWGTLRGEFPDVYDSKKNKRNESLPLRGNQVEEAISEGKNQKIFDIDYQKEELGDIWQILKVADIKSILLVPIVFQGKVIGSFSLDSIRHSRDFTNDEIILCRQLATSVGIAIQNAINRNRYEYLVHLNETLNKEDNPTECLDDLVESMVFDLRLFEKATFSLILLYDEKKKSMVVKAACPIDRKSKFQWDPEVNSKVISVEENPEIFRNELVELLKESEYSILDYTKNEDTIFLNYIASQLNISHDMKGATFENIPEIASAILVPLRIPMKLLGLLIVGEVRHRRGNLFTDDQAKQAKIACDQAALIIERIQNGEKIRKNLDDIHKLREFGVKLTHKVSGSLKDTLQFIVDEVCGQFGASCASIYPYLQEEKKYDSENIILSGFKCEVERFVNKENDDLGKIAEITLSRKVLFVNNIHSSRDQENEIDISFSRGSLPDEEGIIAFACIGLFSGENCLGFLYVNYLKEHYFSDYEKELITLFAHQAAEVILQNRLFVKASDKSITLQNAMFNVLNEMTRLKNTLPNTLRSICDALKSVLDCDIVSGISYDHQSGLLIDSPEIAGSLFEKKEVADTNHLQKSKIIQDLLRLKDPYFCPDVTNDSIMNQGGFIKREKIISSIGIPIFFDSNPCGLIIASFRQFHVFDDEERNAVKIFSGLASVTINNARQYQREQAQTKILKSIQKTISKIISSRAQKTLDQDLISIFSQFADDFNWDAASLMWLDDEGDEFTVQAKHGLNKNYPQTISKNLIQSIIKNNENYFYIPDLRKSSQKEFSYFKNENIRSWISIPIREDENNAEVEGLLNIYSRDKIVKWTPNERDNLVTIADEIHLAIHQIESVEQITANNRAFIALWEVCRKASSDDQLKEILQVIIEQALKLTGLSGTPAYLGTLVLCHKKNILELYASDPVSKIINLETGKSFIDLINDKKIGIIGRAYKSAKSQKVIDVSKDPDYFTLDNSTKSEIAVPIKIGDKILGVLNVEHKDINGLTQEDQIALEILANLAAIAIANSKNRDEINIIQKKVGGRIKLASMGMASSTTLHSVRAQTTVIRDNFDLIKNRIKTYENKNAFKELGFRQYLPEIDRAINEIFGLKVIAPILSHEDVLPVVISDFIREYCQICSDIYFKQGIKFEFKDLSDEDAIVSINPIWLRHALDLLIANSVRSVTNSDNKEISFVLKTEDSKIEFVITDTGCGMKKEVAEVLFSDQIQDTEGLGTGCLTVSVIMQIFGGEARVESTTTNGTSIMLKLPIQE